jgi:hypothetical protein
MKKRVLALLLVILVSVLSTGYALAEAPQIDEPASSVDIIVQPMSTLTLTCGLSKVSGSTYNVWATCRSAASENLTVSYTLYRIVSGAQVYVTSSSASATGFSVTASKQISLSAGTYKLYVTGSGNTSSTSRSNQYTI